MSDFGIWLSILGMALVSVLARGFFLLSDQPLPMPAWAREALRVAPLAALVAVIAPELLMKDGALLGTWQDPRWPAALAGSLFYFWRRGILGCIVVGMTVFLFLKFALHW
ncbi:MAG: AzlD domain-containing protein [Burkholderiales bacterium]|uniref:AzlD domain-containing protein n=1 Tax=Inhella sp. TaxID=1921806 RepID=UPI001AD3CF8A|nr:AzlD domain-containing protein [Burkholderiales bacterium]